jgi:hypothetical protein
MAPRLTSEVNINDLLISRLEEGRTPIPLRVLNRLRLGRDVAARVRPRDPSNLAWVYVIPLVDHVRGSTAVVNGERTALSLSGEPPVCGFVVRYIEVAENIIDEYNREERDDPEHPAHDERAIATNEDELADILRLYTVDLDSLHIPIDVGYVFEPTTD